MRAAVPNYPFGRRRPALTPDRAALTLNLSYVLHERSGSMAVARTAAACERHAARVTTLRLPAQPDTIDGQLSPGVDVWLTATLGVPAALAEALVSMGAESGIVALADAVGEGFAPPVVGERVAGGCEQSVPRQPPHPSTRGGRAPFPRVAPFFRAHASLTLPDGAARVGVAALVLRPGARTTQLALRGPFAWPHEESAALRALERLIQAYANQWMPPRALWDAPAEVALDGEIG